MSAELGWHPTTQDWQDDGDDCMMSSIACALWCQEGRIIYTLAELENAYQEVHPNWDNRASTIILSRFWPVLHRRGIDAEPVHGHGDLVDMLARWLAIGHVPAVWIFIYDPQTDLDWHHAVVCVDYRDGWLHLWDQQVGEMRYVPVEEFMSDDAPIRSSGYAWVFTVLPF